MARTPPKRKKPAGSSTSGRRKVPDAAAAAWPLGAAIAKRPATKSTKRAPLVAALDAVRTQQLSFALSALLVAWRTAPTDGIAEAIRGLTTKLRTAHAVRGKTNQAMGAWTTLANHATPQDLPALLDTLTDVSSGEALKRLTFVKRWMPDPRIDAAIVDWLERVPYRATSTRPFWTALFRIAAAITDRRQLRRLEHCNADGVAATMQTWLRAKIATLREDTASKFDGDPEPVEVTDILELLGQLGIGGGKLSRGSKNLEALLQAIHDAPDDDAPRLVYADALLERGDPRGEFIALQLRPEADRDAKKREKELLATHGKQWLGDLAPVVMSGYAFARGFLSECKVDNRHLDRLRRLAGHPSWSTVRSISGSALIALHPVMKGLRRLSFTSYEARNHEELPDSWKDLLIGTERPIEALRYAGIETEDHWEDALENNDSVRPGVQGRWVYVPQAQEVAALCSCSALPKLRELVVVASPDLIVAPLLASPLIHRLDTLGFVFDYRGTWTADRGPALALFSSLLQTAPVPTLRFELGPDYHTTYLELARHATGYRTATMTVGPTSRSTWSEVLVNEAIGVLDSLPASVRELRITTRRHTDLQQAARLRAAAEQMKLDVCDVSF